MIKGFRTGDLQYVLKEDYSPMVEYLKDEDAQCKLIIEGANVVGYFVYEILPVTISLNYMTTPSDEAFSEAIEFLKKESREHECELIVAMPHFHAINLFAAHGFRREGTFDGTVVMVNRPVPQEALDKAFQLFYED